jgi:hypothetical protein
MANVTIAPTVFADAVLDELESSLRIAKYFAVDYTDDVDEILSYGEEVNFPSVDAGTPAEELSDGDVMTPEGINMSDCKATIKQVGKARRVTDKQSAQIKGRVKDEIIQDVARSIAAKIDDDLVDEMRDSAVYTDDLDELTESDLYDAMAVFGDKADTADFMGILINSRLTKSFMGMNGFIDLTKTTATDKNGETIDGCIGRWNGIPVIMCNRETLKEGKALLAFVKNGSLGIIWQKTPNVEVEREAKAAATDSVTNVLYAVKLRKADGVSLLEVTVNP